MTPDEAEALPQDTLAEAAPAIRARLDRFRRALGRFFVDRQEIVDLMTVCAVAQEPLLLVGPPGTAKSELVTKFRQALSMPDEDAFEYMLTRFTEPAEIFGPIDLNLLREGRYVRRDRGKLPTARLVFLDEIFKSSSAILNALLTVINERKFYQDGAPVPVKLRVLFAATNDVPDHEELAALRDRFVLKVGCRPVGDRLFTELLEAGLDAQAHRDLNQRPWAEGHASLADLLAAHRHLAFQLRERERFFPAELLAELRRVLRTLVREDEVFISDRKIVKLYKLIRARAWIFHGGTVEREDLLLTSYLGESREQMELLEEKVPRLLGLS